jgi:hypothetical protein
MALFIDIQRKTNELAESEGTSPHQNSVAEAKKIDFDTQQLARPQNRAPSNGEGAAMRGGEQRNRVEQCFAVR